MRFDLVRPCGECPFRSDREPFIEAARVREILGDPAASGASWFPSTSFACHKTVNYRRGASGRVGAKSQHCAGVALVLVRDGVPNTAMQLAERLLSWDAGRLDQSAPAYESRAAAIAAHEDAP